MLAVFLQGVSEDRFRGRQLLSEAAQLGRLLLLQPIFRATNRNDTLFFFLWMPGHLEAEFNLAVLEVRLAC